VTFLFLIGVLATSQNTAQCPWLVPGPAPQALPVRQRALEVFYFSSSSISGFLTDVWSSPSFFFLQQGARNASAHKKIGKKKTGMANLDHCAKGAKIAPERIANLHYNNDVNNHCFVQLLKFVLWVSAMRTLYAQLHFVGNRVHSSYL
jgi:hypothetical protein